VNITMDDSTTAAIDSNELIDAGGSVLHPADRAANVLFNLKGLALTDTAEICNGPTGTIVILQSRRGNRHRSTFVSIPERLHSASTSLLPITTIC
jgi:hypothetical protein